ncbi:MAG: fatty-acid synthase [Anaerolineae bacterium]|nr:fatty-acid synthase [Anaerolineae bacterium]
MPRRDEHHNTVVAALQKDGWIVTNTQPVIRVGKRRIWVDIRALKPETGSVTFVEVKEIVNTWSPVLALRNAIGQYLLYRAAMKYIGIDGQFLYLAVSSDAYAGILSEPIGRLVLTEAQIRLVVFDPKVQEIVRWIPYPES